MATVTSSGVFLTVDVPPKITTQPVNQTVKQGQTATFSFAATGTPSATIQWFETGNSVPLATGTKLTLTNVQPTAAGSYMAVATNGIATSSNSGTVTSSAVTLTVDTAPVISLQPVATTVTLGQTTVFTVTASLKPSARFRLAEKWRRDRDPDRADAHAVQGLGQRDSDLFGSDQEQRGHGDFQRSIAYGGCPGAAITTQPVKITVNQGKTATFSVVATGTPAATIQWFETGNSTPLATGAKLELGQRAANRRWHLFRRCHQWHRDVQRFRHGHIERRRAHRQHGANDHDFDADSIGSGRSNGDLHRDGNRHAIAHRDVAEKAVR